MAFLLKITIVFAQTSSLSALLVPKSAGAARATVVQREHAALEQNVPEMDQRRIHEDANSIKDERCRPPEASRFRRTVLAVHGVNVDENWLAKFEVLENYRPYFLDIYYIQMRGDVSHTTYFLPDSGPQLNLSQRTQRTFDCGSYREEVRNNVGSGDLNSYGCMAVLMSIVQSKANTLYGFEPEGFFYLHADFWITPRFTTNIDTTVPFSSNDACQKSWNNYCKRVTDPVQEATDKFDFWNFFPSAKQAANIAERDLHIRVEEICKQWMDFYFVPQTATKTWIALALLFAQHKVNNEYALGTIDQATSISSARSCLTGIVGGCCEDLIASDILNASNDAGHRVDLRNEDVLGQMGRAFDCK